MESQKLRTLKILEAVDNGDAPSQRDLARQLNISLGLVNSFIKRLVNKGYFKITTIPRNRVKYILTPKGAAEKTRLTYEYIQFSFQFYRETRFKLTKLLKAMVASGVKRLAIYGATELAEIAYLSMQEQDLQLVIIVDPKKIGQKFLNRKVKNLEKLKYESFDGILVVDFDTSEELMAELNGMGIQNNRIFILT